MDCGKIIYDIEYITILNISTWITWILNLKYQLDWSKISKYNDYDGENLFYRILLQYN